jgi:Phage integrase family
MKFPPRRSQPTTEKGIRKEFINGRYVYRVQLQRGHRRASRICDSLEQALAIKKEWLAGGLPDDSPPPADAPPATLEDGLRHYVLRLQAHPGKDVARARQLGPVLEREMPDLLRKPLALIDDDDFSAFVVQREHPRLKRNGQTEAIKPNTIIRDLRVLRAAVRLARPDFRLASTVFPAAEERVRFLDPSEEVLLDTALEVDAHATLARLGQLMLTIPSAQHDWRLLRRERVHLTERRIEFPVRKGTVRPVDNLTDQEVALLRAQLASHDSPWVFVNLGTGRPYSRVHLHRTLRRAIRAAGRDDDFTPHDLKHHASCSLVAAGATDRELQTLGGWRNPTMVTKYAHARNARLRALKEAASPRHRGSIAHDPTS